MADIPNVRKLALLRNEIEQLEEAKFTMELRAKIGKISRNKNQEQEATKALLGFETALLVLEKDAKSLEREINKQIDETLGDTSRKKS